MEDRKTVSVEEEADTDTAQEGFSGGPEGDGGGFRGAMEGNTIMNFNLSRLLEGEPSHYSIS